MACWGSARTVACCGRAQKMACWESASDWAKIGFISIVLAFGLQSAAILTNYWMLYNTVKDMVDLRVGLFWLTNCSTSCSTYSSSSFSSCK